jgi:hypothetical protein
MKKTKYPDPLGAVDRKVDMQWNEEGNDKRHPWLSVVISSLFLALAIMAMLFLIYCGIA